MSNRRLLVRGGLVITRDAGTADLVHGDLLIEGDRIVDVAPNIQAPDAEVIEAGGMIVLPGLIDAHRHLWYTVLRNRFTDATGASLFSGGAALIAAVDPDDVHAATLLGALECLDAGITSVVDYCHITNSPGHTDAAVQALRDAGIRARFVYGVPGWARVPDVAEVGAELARLRREVFSTEGLLTLAAGPVSPDFQPIQMVASMFAAARAVDAPVSVHVGAAHAQGGIQRLAEADLLGPDVQAIHAAFSTDAEFQRLADAGSVVAVCPSAEALLGLGPPATRRLIAAGIRPAIGLDSVLAGGGSLIAELRLALALARLEEATEIRAGGGRYEAVSLTADDVLSMATSDGALGTWAGERVGRLRPGALADVVLIRSGDINLTPIDGIDAAIRAIVVSAEPGNIDTVLVGGRVVKRAGHLVEVDLERARTAAARTRANITVRLAAGSAVAGGGTGHGGTR